MENAKWWVSVTAAGCLVAATAISGVVYNQQYRVLHDAPVELAAPQVGVVPLGDAAPADTAELRKTLGRLAGDPRLGELGLQVSNVTTGEVVFERKANDAMTPASSTKVLTAAAALERLGTQHTVTTKAVQLDESTVVIRSAGDVWMTDARVKALASGIAQHMPKVQQVLVDVSAWPGERILPGWNAADIDGGYVAPLEPLMLYGGRIGAIDGDVPRSHTPALDVGRAVAKELGVSRVDYAEDAQAGKGSADDADAAADAGEEKEVATSVSAPLRERIEAMLEESDNVMAEAIAREIDAANPVDATLSTLRELGIELGPTTIGDNCGLSTNNRITPAVLDQIMAKAAQTDSLRPLLAGLPIAGGTGTLAHRFSDLDGRGWVRAKTGTLTGVSALTGVVPGESGNLYSFGMISNKSQVPAARLGLDQLASALRNA